MRNETIALREDLDRASMFEEIVGSSPALQNVLAQVRRSLRPTHRADSRRKREREKSCSPCHSQRSRRASGAFIP